MGWPPACFQSATTETFHSCTPETWPAQDPSEAPVPVRKRRERVSQGVPAADAELVVNGLQAGLDGAHGELEARGDVLVRQAVRGISGGVPLGLGQVVVGGE